MPLRLALLLCLTAAPPALEPAAKVDSLFTRVHPEDDKEGRSPGQTRAIVLIHGLNLFTGGKEKANKAALRVWQQPRSYLVKELSDDGDVYSFAYAQAVPVEKVHEATALRAHVRGLKKMGYAEIVLVGHSAGGLVARHFVEDDPDSGVTRVVQVCAPNLGSSLAGLKAAREANRAFLTSLSVSARALTLSSRKEVKLPPRVEFACVVGELRFGTDGLVALSSQWSEDLQKQGVPAHVFKVAHWDAVKTVDGARFIGRVVRRPQPRWSDDEVNAAKRKLLGN